MILIYIFIFKLRSLEDINILLEQSLRLIKSESSLLEISLPVNSNITVVGDVHGQFDDVMVINNINHILCILVCVFSFSFLFFLF